MAETSVLLKHRPLGVRRFESFPLRCDYSSTGSERCIVVAEIGVRVPIVTYD